MKEFAMWISGGRDFPESGSNCEKARTCGTCSRNSKESAEERLESKNE